MSKKVFNIIIYLALQIIATAQTYDAFYLTTQILDDRFIPALDEKISEYQTLEIPTSLIFDLIKDGDIHDIVLYNDDFQLKFKIWENNLISDKATVRTSDGILFGKENFGVKTFDIITDSGQSGALTIGPDYISGTIGGYYVQPLHEISGGTNTRQYIIFSEDHVLNYINLICDQETESLNSKLISLRSTQCFKGDVDIADDYSFFQQQGSSITNVQNWNIAKLNTTKTRFDNEFSNPVQYTLDEQFIVTSAATEPWPLNITITALLTQFAYWGEGDIGGYGDPGFSTTPNQASLWTNRSNITGPFGVAYNGEFCSFYGYNVVKQVSTLSDKLQTHEMGHGMNMAHVSPANTIYYMNATISSAAAQWKTDNVNEIQNYLSSSPCANPELYCPALPIELYKLEAYPFDCNDIIFKWVTLSETNTAYFIVEHSDSDFNFVEVGRIDATGGNGVPQYYEFRDLKPFQNLNYYRIISVDWDGKKEIHPIRSAKNTCTPSSVIKNNFVNDGVLFINCDKNCSDNEFIISDLKGNIILFGNLSPTIDVRSLTTGMYFFNSANVVEKFIVK